MRSGRLRVFYRGFVADIATVQRTYRGRGAHASDDGVIDRPERRDIKLAKQRQLENGQRGIAGFKPYRTIKWMSRGIKDRVSPSTSNKRRKLELLCLFSCGFFVRILTGDALVAAVKSEA